MDISGNLILVEFSEIFKLVELGGFFGYIDISGNLRLISLSKLSRIRFRV